MEARALIHRNAETLDMVITLAVVAGIAALVPGPPVFASVLMAALSLMAILGDMGLHIFYRFSHIMFRPGDRVTFLWSPLSSFTPSQLVTHLGVVNNVDEDAILPDNYDTAFLEGWSHRVATIEDSQGRTRLIPVEFVQFAR